MGTVTTSATKPKATRFLKMMEAADKIAMREVGIVAHHQDLPLDMIAAWSAVFCREMQKMGFMATVPVQAA